MVVPLSMTAPPMTGSPFWSSRRPLTVEVFFGCWGAVRVSSRTLSSEIGRFEMMMFVSVMRYWIPVPLKISSRAASTGMSVTLTLTVLFKSTWSFKNRYLD